VVKGIRPSVFLEEGLGEVFYCWIRRKIDDHTEAFEASDPSNYVKISWREKAYTVFDVSEYRKPRGIITVSLRSKEVFPFGAFQLDAKLPDWKGRTPTLWFGFECDDLFRGGVVHFAFNPGRKKMLVCAGSSRAIPCTDISFALPKDYSLTRHLYSIYVHQNIALWFIDERIVAMAILSHRDETRPLHIASGPPYALFVSCMLPSTSLPILVDIDGEPDREWVWSDFHPWQIRVLPGQPRAVMSMSLYAENQHRKVVEIKAKSPITTHPVPTSGFNKTYFILRGSEKYSVRIEAFSIHGHWYLYDEAKARGERPFVYGVDGQPLAVRLVIEPLGSELSMDTAEVYLA